MNIIKILIKTFISWIFTNFICIMPMIAYNVADLPIPFIIPVMITIIALIYFNWAIWSKGIFKKIIMLIVLFFYIAIGSSVFYKMAGLESSYCIEDENYTKICN